MKYNKCTALSIAVATSVGVLLAPTGATALETEPISAFRTAPQTTPTGEPLAEVNGIVVRADIAPNLQSLLAAAENDGIELRGSGFRIGPRIPGKIGRPGPVSPHEKGLAIDFYSDRGVVRAGSVEHDWLTENAPRFGFEQTVQRESWHWEYTG